MSGAIIFRSGGPITWKTDRQERTSLSSCEAEIRATNMGSRLTVNVRNMILHLASTGYPITDAQQATPLYNDNEACVDGATISLRKATVISSIAKMLLANG